MSHYLSCLWCGNDALFDTLQGENRATIVRGTSYCEYHALSVKKRIDNELIDYHGRYFYNTRYTIELS